MNSSSKLVTFSYFSVSDNDQPSIRSSNNYPVENVDNVNLTCVASTTDAITGYEWYKEDTKLNETDGHTDTYLIPGNERSNSGSYRCKVSTTNAPISAISSPLTITFYCKLLFIHHVAFHM